MENKTLYILYCNYDADREPIYWTFSRTQCIKVGERYKQAIPNDKYTCVSYTFPVFSWYTADTLYFKYLRNNEAFPEDRTIQIHAQW